MPTYSRLTVKDSSLYRQNITNVSQSSVDAYGTTYSKNYPLTSSITIHFFPNQSNLSSSQYGNIARTRLFALEALFRKYRKHSDAFQFSSSYAVYSTDDICLINIPSILIKRIS